MSKPSLSESKPSLSEILNELTRIVEQVSEPLEGNCFTYHLSTTPARELEFKRNNYRALSEQSSFLFEIGFNAGHSAACFLSANPHLRMLCLDIGEHSYVQPCFKYLQSIFGDRIQLKISSSQYILDVLDSTFYRKFDLVHIDGAHFNNFFIADTLSVLRYMKDEAYLIHDDTSIGPIGQFCDYLAKNVLFTEVSGQFQPTLLYQHRIFQFNRPKVGIATMAIGEQYREKVAKCRESLLSWVHKYGYDLVETACTLDESRPLPWSKIKLLQKHLENYDYLIWIDADAMITNPVQTIDELMMVFPKKCEFVMTSHPDTLNSGVFFVKNCPKSFEILNDIWNQEQFIHHPWWEQAAIIDLFLTQGRHRENLCLIDSKYSGLFNSPKSLYFDTWKPGDFLVHFAGVNANSDAERFSEMVEEVLAQLKKDRLDAFECWQPLINYLVGESAS